MYSSAVGVNGPVRYSVKNTDGTATDKATIEESTGRLTALKPGQIKIRATYTGAPYIWSWTATIEESMEGTWFIQNRHESLYMQVDDDDEPNYTNDGGIAEVRSFNGADYQKWIFTNAGDGYYKITSKISGYAVTVPSGEETEEDVDLVLKPYTGSNNQKWKITITSYGSYKIKAKSSESITDRDLVMVVQTDILYSEGLNIQQRQYIDNTSYKDEWIHHKQQDYTLMYIGYSVGDPEMPPIVNTVSSKLKTNAGMKGYEYTSLTNKELLVHLSSTSIFSCITHGLQTQITTTDGALTVSDINSLSSSAFDDLKFVYLGACYTGQGGSGANNLVNAVYNKGADAVLGFKTEIFVSEANSWTKEFMSALSEGKTLREAMQDADDAIRNDGKIVVPYYSTGEAYRYLVGSNQLIPCN